MPRGPLHRALRDGTAASHHAVEAHPWMRSLLMPTLSHSQYADVLSAFLVWYRTLEAWLYPLSCLPQGEATGWRYQPRVPALEQDLARLRFSPTPFPRPQLAGESDPSSVLGVLYVVEGSTLGGRVIAHKLRSALGPEVPVEHFLRDDGVAWPAFVDMMETHAERFDSGLAVQAACRTFDGLLQHLNACMESLSHV